MPDPIQTPPTLLSITAAPAADPPRSEGDAFASALTEARGGAERERSTDDATQPGSDTQPERTPTDEDRPAENVPPDTDAETAAATEEEANDLLVVTAAIETLVVPTRPTAELPATVSTQLDVVTIEAPETTTLIDAAPVVDPPTGELSGLAAAEATINPAAPESPAVTLTTAPTTETATQELTEASNLESIAQSAAPQVVVPADAEEPSDPVEGQRPAPTLPAGASAPEPTTHGSAPSDPTTQRTDLDPRIEPDAEATVRLEPTTVAAAEPLADPDASGGENVAPTRESATAPSVNAGALATESPSPLSRPEASEPRPTVDPGRFISRVARAFDIAQERGGGPIELRLSPPELGSLQVKIELREGVLTAALETETPAARQTLLDNLPALRDRLEQQQIRIEKFDVDVRDESQQRGGDGQTSGERRDEAARDRDRREPAAPTQADSSDSVMTAESRGTRSIEFGPDEINLVA